MGEQRPSNMAEDSTPIEVELKVSENNTQRQLNFSAAATVAFAFTFLMLAMVITSPAANLASEAGPSSVEWWNTPLDERHLMDLPMDTLRAQLPVNGTYQALPYEEHFVEVDLPASEQDPSFPTATPSLRPRPSARDSPPTVRTSRGSESKPAFRPSSTGWGSKNGPTATLD